MSNQIIKPRPFAMTRVRIQKHSPEILLGAGIVGVLGATVLACRATLKSPAVLDDHHDRVTMIKDDVAEHPDDYTEAAERKALAVTYGKTAFDFAKLYAIPSVVMAGSIYAITYGHGITMKRNASLTAALSAVSTGYQAYRKRVREVLGEDKERDIFMKRRVEKMELEDEDGKKGKPEDVVIVDAPDGDSAYVRIFDDTSSEWKPSAEINMSFLRAQERFANEKLHIKKVLFLNEVLESLGMPISQAGQVVGWAVTPDGDNYVDFGLFDASDERKRAFINGEESNVWLNFNCDGVVWDLVS